MVFSRLGKSAKCQISWRNRQFDFILFFRVLEAEIGAEEEVWDLGEKRRLEGGAQIGLIERGNLHHVKKLSEQAFGRCLQQLKNFVVLCLKSALMLEILNNLDIYFPWCLMSNFPDFNCPTWMSPWPL